MISYGKYFQDGVNFDVTVKNTKTYTEVLLIINNTVVSAYKNDGNSKNYHRKFG